MTTAGSRDTLESVFPGDGEMARLMREHPWHASPLGPPHAWPQSLKTAVRILLSSRFEMWMAWGPELPFLYNDAYRRKTIGRKHPQALGKPTRELWSEIWADIGPRIEHVLMTGEATWDEALLLFLERSGYPEETYHTFSYSPLSDDNGKVAGMLSVVTEETERVIGERRLRTLRDLAAQLAAADGEEAIFAAVARCLGDNDKDLPFTLTYLFDEGASARLACATGMQQGHPGAPARFAVADGALPWPARELLADGPARTEDLQGRFASLPTGAWSRPPERALIVPIPQSGGDAPAGFLVAGLNPFRRLDESYEGFVGLVAGQIGASLANARAYEEERRRARALAELDRAKTTFFSNVSHEFRTPLTLMLGPVEDILAKPAAEVPPPDRSALEVVHRNGQRLLRLVNTLLDFARIEAGRTQASYEPTDLAALTADLASNFRASCERAGLRLVVECPPAGEAYVDREMWEKIVLNLLSNAFKFTLEGEIEVRLRRKGGAFELTVRDTGTGIPEAALPYMFERFHRVEGAQGRSHEGSGIGLALVQELVKLHGGTIGVASRLGAGSTFTVSIPEGEAHLPAERILARREAASTALRAGAFVDEALSWLPSEGEASGGAVPKAGARRVLLADDNADLREYARRLLAEHFDVEAVADGEAALAAARARRPDLVVTDVMMPRLDGFGLIAALRADEGLRDIPVIALSARAGEEARIEGLGRGADDYLTKPFSARELLVRCEALLRSAAVRLEAEARVRAVVETTPECVKLVAPDGTLLQMNAAGLEMVGAPCAAAVIGRSIYDVIAPEDRERFRAFNERVCAGERGRLEFDIVGLGGARRHMETHAVPLARPQGGCDQLAITRDVTERKRQEDRLRESEQLLRLALEAGRMGVWEWHIASNRVYWSPSLEALHGMPPGTFDGTYEGFRRDIVPDDLERVEQAIARTLHADKEHRIEYRIAPAGGGTKWVEGRGRLFRDAAGRPERMVGVCADVTERKLAEAALLARARQQQAVANLGELALRERDLQKVFEQATASVADALGVELCKVLELLPEGREVLLRAGVGWKEGLVGRARVNTGMDSQAGYTLASEAPVIVADLQNEDRFRGPPLLTEHGVVSGMSCIIRTAGGPWGVLGAHSTRRIEFTKDDVSFLVSVANVLGHAIERERAESALRESDRRKDEFIAMLSHELRNPLAPLRNGLELMRLDAPSAAQDEVREMMVRQVGHLVRLVDDLLESSRISRGFLELRRGPVQLGEVLRAAVESAGPLIREADHRLDVELPHEALWIEADAVRLSQVFTNLLNNAARYTPRGGRIRLHAATVEPGKVRISVRDTGIGFAPDAQQRLFEMFSRGAGSSGLGIGLALARRLVEMHGGVLEARSEGEGRGAEFVVTLALADAPLRVSQPSVPHGGKAIRVLVADDNRDAAESLAAVLEALGNDVKVAYDGIAAVEAARAFRPHMVLLDIGMPELDGYGAAREIRRDSQIRAAKLVALTGWGQEEDRQRVRDAGFDEHIVKPAELEVLRRLLSEVSAEEETER